MLTSVFVVQEMAHNKSKKNPLSDEAKANLKATLKELPKGAMPLTDIVIVPSGVHTQTDYQQIVDVIRGGKAWIMEYRASRNTIYNVRKALVNPQAEWNTEPDPKNPDKRIKRKDAITNVAFGDVQLKTPEGKIPTKNTALYLS